MYHSTQSTKPMKRILFSLIALMAMIVVFSPKASAQSFNTVENRARGAAMNCAAQYHAPHSTVELSLVSTPRCINGGTVYVFDVYVVYHCPPGTEILCLVLAPVRAATVTTDCEGRVDNVVCY
jgi:hypothetical protein